ncbi:hypothetical protein TRVA0_029S00628 [Trichomonascus vanleenenianus]|uniref:F-box protein n=1 Tax=Trichomonascus vanleenenianus TaxID=2268995 RepID=UPI003ECBA2A4
MIPLPVEVVDNILEYLDEDLWSLRTVCRDFYELVATRVWKRVRLVYGFGASEGSEISIHCQSLKKYPWLVEIIKRYSLFLTVDVSENFFPQPENRAALVKALGRLCGGESKLIGVNVLLNGDVRFCPFLDSLLTAVFLTSAEVSVQYSACLFDSARSWNVAMNMNQIREKCGRHDFVVMLSIFSNTIWEGIFKDFGPCIASLSVSTYDVALHDMQFIFEKCVNLKSLTIFADTLRSHDYGYSLVLPCSLVDLKVFGSSTMAKGPKLIAGSLATLTMSLEALEICDVAATDVADLKIVGLNHSSDVALEKLNLMKRRGLRSLKIDTGDIGALKHIKSVLKDISHVELLQLRKKAASQGTPLTFEEYKEIIGLVPNAQRLTLDGSELTTQDLVLIGDILAMEYPQICTCYIAGDVVPSGLNCRVETGLIEFTGLKELKKVFQLTSSTLLK